MKSHNKQNLKYNVMKFDIQRKTPHNITIYIPHKNVCGFSIRLKCSLNNKLIQMKEISNDMQNLFKRNQKLF